MTGSGHTQGSVLRGLVLSLCLGGAPGAPAAPPMSTECPPLRDNTWGPVVQGLRASLSVLPKPPPSERQLRIRFVVHNLGPAPARIVNAGFWPNHRIDLTHADGTPVARTKLGRDALQAFSSGAQRKAVVRPIAPGACLIEEHDIAPLFELRPGSKYRLRVSYEEAALVLPGKPVEFALPP